MLHSFQYLETRFCTRQSTDDAGKPMPTAQLDHAHAAHATVKVAILSCWACKALQ